MTLQRWRDSLALCIPLGAMIWVLSVPQRLGLLVFPEQFLSALLGLALAVVFLHAAIARQPGNYRQLPCMLAGLSIAVGGYLAVRIPVLSEEAFFRPRETLIVAAIAIALVVDATRRSVGYSLLVF